MSEKVFDTQQYAMCARRVVAEGVVLLENRDNVLPLEKGSKIALFGRNQFHYYKSGTGSGGLVNARKVTGVIEAILEENVYVLNETVDRVYKEWLVDHPFEEGVGWAMEPWFQEEMPVTDEFVKKAAEESEAGMILIGRTAGEDKDNKPEAGSYFLTEEEKHLIELVCKYFKKSIVLLNVGNIIDMNWVKEYNPAAVLYIWQGGQEGGLGVVDVLRGEVSPSGHLTDTIAYSIDRYPSTRDFGDKIRNFYREDIYVGYRYFETFAKDEVQYPFGYGLSYTTFAQETEEVIQEGLEAVTFRVKVTNTGAYKGQQVVQVYASAPQGVLGKPLRVLCGYAKTKELLPGESENLTIRVKLCDIASYDDGGVTGHKSAYVLESGEYRFSLGENVRDAENVYCFKVEETTVLEQLEEAMAPVLAFERMKPIAREEGFVVGYEPTPLRNILPMERRKLRIPKELPISGNCGYRLADVESGKITMDTFIAQLSVEELCAIVRGEGMSSPKVTPGTAAAFGGVTESLKEYGIPVGCCADGPSGIRMDCGSIAFSMPNGATLASTFNDELVEQLYRWEGMELRKNKIESLLGPGMNIHRNPLNGRNFEYFSEDPFITGKMAAAQLRGMHHYGTTGTIKHFACNNQEFSRNLADSVVSERALREIYLKGYEIAVKEGDADSVMTTYAPVNGIWTAGNYDLVTTILREEWGFEGIVMTDWWANINEEGKEASGKNTACMVRAQNDLYMVVSDSFSNSTGDNSQEGIENGVVTVAEFQRSAANICRFLMKTPAFLRMEGQETELDRLLAEEDAKEEGSLANVKRVEITDTLMLPVEEIDPTKGKTTVFQVICSDRGIYEVEMEIRAAAGTELSQLPVSVFKDMTLAKTITLNGMDREFRMENVEFMVEPNKTFFLRFYFGQSGMEIKSCRLTLKRSIEAEIEKQINSHFDD